MLKTTMSLCSLWHLLACVHVLKEQWTAMYPSRWTARHAQQVLATMLHALTCVECHTQAREMVQEAKESSQESEDDWEANWEDMDAVPAIGPAAAQAKQKVPLHILCALHMFNPPPPCPCAFVYCTYS